MSYMISEYQDISQGIEQQKLPNKCSGSSWTALMYINKHYKTFKCFIKVEWINKTLLIDMKCFGKLI
jgi:hypothetical protein